MQSTLNQLMVGLHAIRSLKQQHSTKGSEEILEPQKAEQNMKQPINVNTFIIHFDQHADEEFGKWAIRKHGRVLLPGSETAKTRYVLDGPYLSQEEYDRNGWVVLGCGNSRFDEHTPTGRTKNSSCTKLVLDYLEVTDRATLAIGREIHWCDTNKGVSSTQLPGLVNGFHRHYTANGELLSKWAAEAFDAIHHQLSVPFAAEGREYTIETYFEGLVKAGWYKDKKLDHIRKLLKHSVENTRAMSTDRTFYTELNYIVCAMQRAGKTHQQVYDWARSAFECLVKDQELFEVAYDMVKDKTNQYRAPAQVEPHGNIRFCMLHTDNPMCLSAANAASQQVTIIRNTAGQVQIFLDLRTGLTLDYVVGMIRWLETPVEKRANLNFKELCTTPGSMECAPHWYYDRERGQLYNGSRTHPGVLATRLASQYIIDIVIHGFHPSLVGRWMRDHGVLKKSPPPRQIQAPAPVATVQPAAVTVETAGTATSSPTAVEVPLAALIVNP